MVKNGLLVTSANAHRQEQGRYEGLRVNVANSANVTKHQHPQFSDRIPLVPLVH